MRILSLDPSEQKVKVNGYEFGETNFVMGENLVPIVQSFMNNLFMDPGTAWTTQSRGGGLMTVLKKNRRVNDDLKKEIASIINRVEQQMLEDQEARRLSPQDRIARIDLVSVEEGARPDQIEININLQVDSGESLVISL